MIRRSLAESVVLAIGGTLIGAVLALIGVRALTSLVPVQLPPWKRTFKWPTSTSMSPDSIPENITKRVDVTSFNGNAGFHAHLTRHSRRSRSMSTTSEFARRRSKRIRLPSGAMSKSRISKPERNSLI